MTPKNSHAARLALVLAVAACAFAGAAFGQTVSLPAWVAGPASPIAFADGAKVDSTGSAAELFGFPGVARGISVSGGELRIDAFELAPPPGAAFVAPRHPLPGFEPVPAFRSLVLTPGTTGPFQADCSYVRTSDPFGGTFEEGGANLAWDNWHLLAFELALGADGLLARNGFVINLREESERDGVLNGDRAAIVAATIVELRFAPGWKPAPDPGAYADPWVSMPGLGDLAVASVALALEGGALVALVEPREPGEDDWDLAAAPFERATIDGRGQVLSSAARGGVAAFGWEGAFELEFEAETAGVPMTGSGLVRLPESLGGGEFRSAPGAVRAWAGSYWEGENYFEVSAFAEPVRVGYGGWEFALEDASIGRAGDMQHIWALLAPGADLSWRDAPIPLEGLAFSGEGYWLGPGTLAEPTALSLFDGRFTAQEAVFYEDGLVARGFLELPREFGGYSIYIDRLFLYPDGSFDMAEPVWAYAFDLPAGSFRLEDGWLSDEGFGFGSMAFDPAWQAFDGRLRFHGGMFPNEGGLEFRGVDPFRIDGFVFFGEAAVSNGVLAVSGGVYYPEALPYALRRRDPATLRIPLDGSAPSVESSFDSELTVEYGAAGAVRVSRCVLELSGASLRVRLDGVRPAWTAADLEGLSLDGVRMSAEGAWDFGAAVLAAPVTLEREGVAYALDELVLVDEERILLSGRATWTAAGGGVESHGCALSVGFDGSVTIVVAEGDELRYLR